MASARGPRVRRAGSRRSACRRAASGGRTISRAIRSVAAAPRGAAPDQPDARRGQLRKAGQGERGTRQLAQLAIQPQAALQVHPRHHKVALRERDIAEVGQRERHATLVLELFEAGQAVLKEGPRKIVVPASTDDRRNIDAVGGR